MAMMIRLALGVALVAAAVRAKAAEQCETPPTGAPAEKLPWIRVSDDKTHFVEEATGRRIVMWGVNYDHDERGRLIEDYWHPEWAQVAADFAEIKALGSNVVRVHLQLARFMDTAEKPNAANLAKLGELVRLAERTGLYLDVTGLGCYHKPDVPAWYDALKAAARWDVQARFWRAVAGVCKDSPAVFCYDLMNEPVLPGEKKETEWLGRPLGDKYFVQRIALDLGGKTRNEVARDWVKKLTSAIREVDQRHLLTVGVIPWVQVFKGAKPLFYAPEVGEPFDFASVHFYPKKGKLAETLDALAMNRSFMRSLWQASTVEDLCYHMQEAVERFCQSAFPPSASIERDVIQSATRFINSTVVKLPRPSALLMLAAWPLTAVMMSLIYAQASRILDIANTERHTRRESEDS